MTDVNREITATARQVRAGAPGEERVAVLERTYGTNVEDLWDACTNPERIPRWFLPVSGDLQAGGRFQLEGNAGGTIERCDPPTGLRATWEFGGAISWIELRLTAVNADTTQFELAHIVRADDTTWARFGPGAVGIGWELGLSGLARHLAGEVLDAAAAQAWVTSEEGRRFVAESSQRWRAAAAAAGTEPDTAAAWAARTAAFYTGAPQPE
jgi:uncharacterized protein YndB with AHSA1/START domain